MQKNRNATCTGDPEALPIYYGGPGSTLFLLEFGTVAFFVWGEEESFYGRAYEKVLRGA